MSEPDELARRYLTLWSEYLSALLADPRAAEQLRRWIGGFAEAAPIRERADEGPSRSPARAAPVAGASRDDGAAVVELAGRVAELERRLARLERPGDGAAPARRRNRRSGD